MAVEGGHSHWITGRQSIGYTLLWIITEDGIPKWIQTNIPWSCELFTLEGRKYFQFHWLRCPINAAIQRYPQRRTISKVTYSHPNSLAVKVIANSKKIHNQKSTEYISIQIGFDSFHHYSEELAIYWFHHRHSGRESSFNIPRMGLSAFTNCCLDGIDRDLPRVSRTVRRNLSSQTYMTMTVLNICCFQQFLTSKLVRKSWKQSISHL